MKSGLDPCSTSHRKSTAGFTLVEVLVAVTILALALGAIISSGSGYVRDTAQLRDRLVATWIAENQIATIRLETPWPVVTERRGYELMAGTEWLWTSKVSATADSTVRKLTVSVSHAEAEEISLIVLHTFLAKAKS